MILPIRAIFVMQSDYGLLSRGRYDRDPEQSQLSRHDVSRLNARVVWRMQHLYGVHPGPFPPLTPIPFCLCRGTGKSGTSLCLVPVPVPAKAAIHPPAPPLHSEGSLSKSALRSRSQELFPFLFGG